MVEVVSTGVSHMCDNSTVSVKLRIKKIDLVKHACMYHQGECIFGPSNFLLLQRLKDTHYGSLQHLIDKNLKNRPFIIQFATD